MASTVTRRPLPALISLLALIILTALVWWRVASRDDGGSAAAPTSRTPSPTASHSPCPSGSAGARVSGTPDKAVAVTVLNSTDRSGLAAATKTTLVKDGFTVAKVGNDPNSSITGSARITYTPAAKTTATLLGYYLPGAQLVPGTGSGAVVTVVLGNGFSALATPAQVQAALKSGSAATC